VRPRGVRCPDCRTQLVVEVWAAVHVEYSLACHALLFATSQTGRGRRGQGATAEGASAELIAVLVSGVGPLATTGQFTSQNG
jgi:hypothetical protein